MSKNKFNLTLLIPFAAFLGGCVMENELSTYRLHVLKNGKPLSEASVLLNLHQQCYREDGSLGFGGGTGSASKDRYTTTDANGETTQAASFAGVPAVSCVPGESLKQFATIIHENTAYCARALGTNEDGELVLETDIAVDNRYSDFENADSTRWCSSEYYL